MRISKRISLSLAAAAVLTLGISGIASACPLTAKTIDTEAGSCAIGGGPNCQSAATYGANGFTGTLTFADNTGSTNIVDYICVPVGTNPVVWKTFGGTYHLSLFNGASQIGSTATYTVTGGLLCGSKDATSGVNLTPPAGLTVTYHVTIDGITAGSSAQAAFGSYPDLRNDAWGSFSDHVTSYTVPPPTNFIIPEAPFAVLLPLSAGLLAALYLVRRPRKSVVAAA
jgi:hypothetical protein